MQSGQIRSCGNCTACCDGWLRIEVRGHQVHPGKACPFRVDRSCSIYEDRPQHPCREFVCGWLVASSPLPDWMRPDKSDLILLAANFVWRGLPVDVAVAAGARPKKKALDWLMKFNSERRRCLIYRRRVVCIRAAGFPNRDFWAHSARRYTVGGLKFRASRIILLQCTVVGNNRCWYARKAVFAAGQHAIVNKVATNWAAQRYPCAIFVTDYSNFINQPAKPSNWNVASPSITTPES